MKRLTRASVILAVLLGVAILTQAQFSATVRFQETPTYVAYVGSAVAASKDHLNVFNASGSGQVLRITRIWISTANTAAVNGGSNLYYVIDKTSTAGTTCTAVTIRLADSNNPAVPAQVTANSNCTTDPTTVHTWLGCHHGSSEETAVVQQHAECYRFSNSGGQPITLRVGEGIAIKQTGISPTGGTIGFYIEFTMTTS